MITWDLSVEFGAKEYILMAELNRISPMSMRIVVYGLKGSLTFTNNYPVLHKAQNPKKPLMWSLVEGKVDQSNPKVAKLITDIIAQLEKLVREKYPMDMPMF